METRDNGWTAWRQRRRTVRWLVACSLVVQCLVVQCLAVGRGWAQGGNTERRSALVIGNSTYHRVPLVNPVNDAQAMATTLKSVGFTVQQLENASKGQMTEAIQRFGDNLKRGGVGLFYFAGHGLQINGENFLLPIDDAIDDKDRVRDKGVEANAVLREMSQAKNRLNVVILDACRNNPFGSGASRGLTQTDSGGNRVRSDAGGGLAAMEALVGTLIAFATAPESVAADGAGKNGVYTENLLRHLTEPGLKIEDVFKRTRFAVRQETSGRQVPWENTSLEGDFYFVPPGPGSTGSSGATAATGRVGADQQASLQAPRSETRPDQPSRGGSGFSFSREEEKDRTTRFGKDDASKARLQAPCPDTLRQRPIVVNITEESQTEGLLTTERSAGFAQLVSYNLQQAGLNVNLVGAPGPSARPASGAAGRPNARATSAANSYAIQGVVLSQRNANRIIRLQEASVSAELVLRDPSGRIVSMVEVSGERFAGANPSAAARALTKEQALDASSQLYAAFCGTRN